jgi:hypothetical protein
MRFFYNQRRTFRGEIKGSHVTMKFKQYQPFVEHIKINVTVRLDITPPWGGGQVGS